MLPPVLNIEKPSNGTLFSPAYIVPDGNPVVDAVPVVTTVAALAFAIPARKMQAMNKSFNNCVFKSSEN